MGIWEWNIQSNQTVYNDQWAALLGYTLDELAPYDHTTWERLTHPEDLERASKALIDCVEGRTPEYRCEFRMKHKDGHWVWILDRGRIVSHDAEGKPLSMFGTHTDITDIKSTEEDLRASEAYQSRILQTTADGFWVVDSKGHVVEVNKAYCAMSGYSREELMGMDINDLDAEEKPEETRERIERIVRNGSEVFKSNHRRKDGSVFPLEISTSYLEERGGQFVCFGRDLIQRERTEEALTRKHAMLVRTEALAHVGSWEWEIEGDKVTWSEELFRIYGLEPAEEAPSFAEHQALFVPEDRARLFQAVEECVKNGVPYRLEVGITRADGEARHCVVRGIPERGADGTVKRLYGSMHDITEIRRAEERITVLSRMLDDAPAAITIHDTDGRFVFANAAAVSLHGYESIDEFLEVNLHELDVPDSEARLAERVRMIAETGEARFDVEHYRKDGTTFPLEVLAKHIDWEGRPAILSIAMNIAERRQAEEALRQSEEKFRSLADTAKVTISIVADVDGSQYLYVNDEWARLHGYSKEEAQHIRPIDTIAPEYRQQVLDNAAKRIEGKQSPENYELQTITKSGERKYLDFSSKIIDFENQKAFLTTAVDITERKEAEERTAASEEKFRRAFITSPDSININRMSDGKYIEFNEGFLRIMGYKREEVTDRTSEELNIWNNPEDRKRLVESLQSDGYVENLPAQFRRADGTIREGLMSASVIELNGEKHILSITRDVTESKQVEAEREELQIQLNQAQKMESVGRLAGGVAHDFNNMLNVILGYTELAFDGLPADSPLRDDLGEVRKAAERSANLTRQLLAFARKQTVAPKVVDLNGIIASMLKMLERLIGEDIDLLWRPRAQLAQVHIDPGQVDQMLVNLVVNARDAIGHRNGKITIETSNAHFDEDYCADHAGFTPGDYVMLAVSDDGCGMDAETSAHVFEPFFTTKGTGLGTGLGLATSYGIVRQNNGFVNVYSEPDKGTTFRIYLPATKEESRERADSRTVATAPMGGDETTLVVEDEAAILNMARTMLERLGYTVLTAGTPSEAIRLAQEQSDKIDLIITDVVMPEMNGRDLLESLQEYCPGVRCLFMSGYTANVIAHQGVLDDGVNFIQKPFSPDDLARKVREALES